MGGESSILQDEFLKIVPRKQWGARAPFYIDPMDSPVPSVMILTTHTIRFPWWNEEKSFKTLRELQLFHMYQKIMPDIQYNFLIDAFGTVYEGRGWTTKPSLNPGEKRHINLNTIFIGYVGDFRELGPSDSHMKAANDLISFGMRHEMINYHHHISGRIEGIIGTTLEACRAKRTLQVATRRVENRWKNRFVNRVVAPWQRMKRIASGFLK